MKLENKGNKSLDLWISKVYKLTYVERKLWVQKAKLISLIKTNRLPFFCEKIKIDLNIFIIKPSRKN